MDLLFCIVLGSHLVAMTDNKLILVACNTIITKPANKLGVMKDMRWLEVTMNHWILLVICGVEEV